jgi:iron complex outermembrane receptor protein
MKYFLSATFLLAHIVCTAQTGGIRGTVKTGDNKPAEYVDVVLKGTNMAVTTDKKGNYHIKNVAPGTYTVVVPVLGLKAEETTVTVKDGEVAGADLVLTEDYKKLQEVVVTSNTGRYKSNVPSQSLRVNTPLLQSRKIYRW